MRRRKYLLHFPLDKTSLYYHSSPPMIFWIRIIFLVLYSINSTPDTLEIVEDCGFSFLVFLLSIAGTSQTSTFRGATSGQGAEETRGLGMAWCSSSQCSLCDMEKVLTCTLLGSEGWSIHAILLSWDHQQLAKSLWCRMWGTAEMAMFMLSSQNLF